MNLIVIEFRQKTSSCTNLHECGKKASDLLSVVRDEEPLTDNY